jgi:hypothetical protein
VDLNSELPIAVNGRLTVPHVADTWLGQCADEARLVTHHMSWISKHVDVEVAKESRSYSSILAVRHKAVEVVDG